MAHEADVLKQVRRLGIGGLFWSKPPTNTCLLSLSLVEIIAIEKLEVVRCLTGR